MCRVAGDVTGLDMPLVGEHAARQAGEKPVTVHKARGRLVGDFYILARAWLWPSNRIPEI